MKKLCLPFILAMIVMLVAGGAGNAHLNDYNAASTKGKIVVRYNSTMTEEYRKYFDNAFASWNKTSTEAGNANFPEFVYDTPEIRSTVEVGLYRESSSTLGYYRYYSGPRPIC